MLGGACSNAGGLRAFQERSQLRIRELANSFGTAGHVTALNQKIIELAERNIDTNFDLAMNLCRAKTLAEIMELQTVYWQKQFGELKTLTDEVRRRSAKTRAGAGVARRT